MKQHGLTFPYSSQSSIQHPENYSTDNGKTVSESLNEDRLTGTAKLEERQHDVFLGFSFQFPCIPGLGTGETCNITLSKDIIIIITIIKSKKSLFSQSTCSRRTVRPPGHPSPTVPFRQTYLMVMVATVKPCVFVPLPNGIRRLRPSGFCAYPEGNSVTLGSPKKHLSTLADGTSRVSARAQQCQKNKVDQNSISITRDQKLPFEYQS